MNIVLRTLPPMHLAAAVTKSPNIDFRGAWGTLHGALPTLPPAPSRVRLSVFETSAVASPGSMRSYSAAVTMAPGATVAAPLEALEVRGGMYAVATYEGPYGGLSGAWGDCAKAIETGEYELDLGRPCLEIYVDDPAVTAPGELRAELAVPVLA